MSKTDDKPSQAPTPAAQPQASTSARSAAPLAVVRPAPPAATAPAPAAGLDEHHGQGGLYVMKNGRRVLAERTEQPKE